MGKKKKNKIIIGLTGGIASGKKTAARVFKALGISVINADEVYENLTRAGCPLNLKIARAFGKNVLRDDLSLNKKALADIVFNVGASGRSSLQKLNKITHPAIIKEIKKQIAAAKNKIIVLAAPLLIEAGQTALVDEVWLIYCPRETQIKRIMRRDGASRAQALARVKAQMSFKEKAKSADVIIRNEGAKSALRERILTQINNLQTRSART